MSEAELFRVLAAALRLVRNCPVGPVPNDATMRVLLPTGAELG